eukprot:GDKI01029915.1.p1 GENE.GDKI01029915.1~~GDKI01029915.1.p1  ORF type:complete len:157 (-),score=25.51 GDKI01029915.1:142-612(-)
MALRLTRLLRFAAAPDVKNRLLLTLASPGECIFESTPIESVTVPGSEGYFTLTNNHSQTVSMIKPGVITVRTSGSEKKDFFVSDGFAFLKSANDGSGCSRAEISGLEVVPVEALDRDKAAQVMSTLSSQAGADEWGKAKTLLGQELCSAIIKAASA